MMMSDTLEAEAYATATVKRAHTSFYWAMRVLEPQKRNAMYAIYAFCRVVDDIADNPGEADNKRARLQLWRTEIANTIAGNPSGPIGQALSVAHRRFDFDQADFLAIIDGMEMDVGVGQTQGRVRISDLGELELYCDRVAGAVGRLSTQVFGLDLQSRESLSVSLGRALQLTNILRDLMEDAAIDRLYLPLELLKRHGIEATEPAEVLASPAIGAVCDDIALMAEQYFAQSDVILSGLQRARVRPAIIMSEIYKRVLRRLNARGWSDLNTSVRLSRLTRVWIAIRYGLLGA
ncbi:MAG: presqualene diphosphate synthase HpnD [Rhodospirillaceae bacterium]|nr:presqualene diphosphate synthase HpnD [Rhodospirillaceae bacterium]MBL6929866.1 presqualene diphosphate synthase HpnD [Rhodospirillales bacterium]MBL6941635.1 presqualene diphosphate synthase HpnD [Rhodospirillales bacterium]